MGHNLAIWVCEQRTNSGFETQDTTEILSPCVEKQFESKHKILTSKNSAGVFRQ